MSAVLYDQPGPRTRRRVLIGSILAAAILIALTVAVLIRLADRDQLSMERWAPLIDPSHEDFRDVWRFLWGGLVNTLKAASLAMLLSLIIGTILAVARVMAPRGRKPASWATARLGVPLGRAANAARTVAAPAYRWSLVGLIEVFRGIPVVLSIFFAARVLPELGVDLPIMWYVVIGLTAYNAVVIAEIVRAGILALPAGQTEASYAVGLTRWQTLRLVLLPQAFRIMLPALISQLVVILKDTALGTFVAYQELLTRGEVVEQLYRNPMQVLLIVGAIFVLINYTLSKIAQYVEWRLSRGRRLREVEAELTATERESTAAAGA